MEYEAFGIITDDYEQEGSQPFGYTGEFEDAAFSQDDTAYVYLRARHYDPTIGRFLSRDSYPGSTSDPMSLNRYSYVHNNPVNMVDPSGHNAGPLESFGGNVSAFSDWLGIFKLAFFDNAKLLTDDAVLLADDPSQLDQRAFGETDQEYWTKVAMNTGEWATINKAEKVFAPHIAESVFEQYPRVGRTPNFGSQAWFFGVRSRIEIAQLMYGEAVIDPFFSALFSRVQFAHGEIKP